MGFPGLSKHLETYAVSTVLGCRTPGCQNHANPQTHAIEKEFHSSKASIDGPAFAYGIYHRLLVNKPAFLNAVDATPTYDEIGRGALDFLAELESYGVKIDRIFFDGYLPSRKREVRINRLEQSLLKLATYRQKYTQGAKIGHTRWQWSPVPSSVVIQPGHPVPSTFPYLIPATFLVPAVIDAISDSTYNSVLFVVPGEADAHCAKRVRDCGGIILTNDSDLFIYDLGSHGAFAFMQQISLRATQKQSEPDGCQTLKALLYRPRNIAERLGLANLQRLAMEIQLKPSLTLPQAISLAKGYKTQSPTVLEKFIRENVIDPPTFESRHFSPEALTRITGLDSQTRFLDPRISEVVCQLDSKEEGPVYVYLLLMIDDPTRSSAWLTSSSHRSFAYSVYLFLSGSEPALAGTIVLECTRRAQRFVFQQVPLFSTREMFDYARNLQSRIQSFQNIFHTCPDDFIWRIYALAEVYHWYMDKRVTPPSREAMTRALTGASGPKLTWMDIHLSAQIQAVLYSLRSIAQFMAVVPPDPEINDFYGLSNLLEKLPPLARLMLSRFELAAQVAGVDIDGVLNSLAKKLQRDVHTPDQAYGSKSKCDVEEELLQVPQRGILG